MVIGICIWTCSKCMNACSFSDIFENSGELFVVKFLIMVSRIRLRSDAGRTAKAFRSGLQASIMVV